jgi:hypothetical protein
MMCRKWKEDNDYETPKHIWDDILHLIPIDKSIWCPFYCNGFSGDYLKSKGLDIIHLEEDFFDNNRGDICIDNPPYRSSQKKLIKREIMKRLKELKKPFMLLVPASTIQTTYFKDLFDTDIQLIIPSKQYQFIKNGVLTKGCPFYTIWICWKMNFKKDIILV